MQRLLWASTGVKDKAYDDTRYVVELAAPNTVNTMPAATLEAVADHGRPHGDAITGTYRVAREVFRDLEQIGIDFADVVKGLEEQGLVSFAKSWDELIASVTSQLEKAGAGVTSEGAVTPTGAKDQKLEATPPAAAPRQTAAA
jgi:transaldolase